MTSRRLTLGLCASLLGLAPATSARADVPPPEDYVEQCTIEVQARPGERCEYCAASAADYTCPDTFAPRGFHRRCSQWGATHRQELWCDGPPIAAIVPPSPALGGGGFGLGMGELVLLGLCCTLGAGALLAVALVLVLRKKRPRG